MVGRTDGLTYRAGIATIHVDFTEAQEIGFGGADLATADRLVERRSPTPPGAPRCWTAAAGAGATCSSR